MKILAIGDAHCKPQVLEKGLRWLKYTNADKLVFLGDACDNWGAKQEDNFLMVEKLHAIKQELGDKFIWLIGNHDWGYYDPSVDMTGHIHSMSIMTSTPLTQYKDEWDIVYKCDDVLFSHAGVDHWFMDEAGVTSIEEINTLKNYPGINNPLNKVGTACGGYDSFPSPLWARPQEIMRHPNGITLQVVGHTPVVEVRLKNFESTKKSMLICDTWSQYGDGKYIGDCSAALIDTVTKEITILSKERTKTAYGKYTVEG